MESSSMKVTGVALAMALGSAFSGSLASADDISLTLRSRVEAPGFGAPRVIETPATWNPKETAVIVCDMWDLHHCLNATRRVNELALPMNALLKAARSRGVLIIHAPSSCMDAYKDNPGRIRMKAIARSKSLPAKIGDWCHQIPSEEAASYPVDQSDGGEDDDPAEHARWTARLEALGRNPRAPWKRQTDALTIDPVADLIGDDGSEIWSALEDRGIKNVILMGVHLNMCVLGRPFGLRQMAKNGKNVVLMRDLTDTMYNPLRAPFVSHFTGTDRVVEHVETYVAPSITSNQILGGAPFRFKDDLRPRIAFLIADDEYKTEKTLPAFASKNLGKDFQVDYLFESKDDRDSLTGSSALESADVLVVSARRRVLPAEQLAAVRRFAASGKGVVGIRTASHAFSPRPNVEVPEGRAVWTEFDPEVLGGHYTGHHGANSPPVVITAVTNRLSHPILSGIEPTELAGRGTLYKVSPLSSSTTPLLMGTIPGFPSEPIIWTNLSASGGRVVSTTLGHPDDFAQPAFERLLRNSLFWASKREISAPLESVSTPPIPFPK